MASEGGSTGCKNPSSAPASEDDEISVIAEIKKGTSGIPKRARYHYIRELPLASVKSLKKSLQKGCREARRSQGRALIPAVGAGCSRTKLPSTRELASRVLHEAKEPRVIELSDEASKMELRRQFKMAEKLYEEEEQFSNTGPSSASAAGKTNVVHKLPPGTVLIKQEPRTPRRGVQDDSPSPSNTGRENDPGSNNTMGNGSSAGATTATTTSASSSNASGSSSASSISSCGSGSSSGSFGSVSASPTDKAKRLDRASDGERGKKIVEVVPRRNPKRCGTSKKGSTSTEAAIVPATMSTGMTTRPRQRQRLLATRRQGRNEGTAVAGTNRRTRLTTMPYMNTRSVTRKLYTVGATHQPPTRKDETEWREWPVHGMHERPVFHPQIGLATGYGGRVFWSTPDAKGSNWTYREVLDAPEEVEIVPVDPRPSRTPSSPASSLKTGPESPAESFKVCMHESLHSVLAYCAQVMTPGYRRAVENKRGRSLDGASEPGEKLSPLKYGEERYAGVELLDAESTHRNLSRLEDSSISDETLMEMSSIYKKLLPVEDQPSSREGSPYSGNHRGARNTGEARSSATKSASEASEIARMLSEYNESLRADAGLGGSSGSAIPVAAPQSSFAKGCREAMDPGVPKVRQKASATGKTLAVRKGVGRSGARDASPADRPKTTSETEMNEHYWLQELLVDTSLLYCVANGVGQRELTKYVDSLDGKQSLQWLIRRDG